MFRAARFLSSSSETKVPSLSQFFKENATQFLATASIIAGIVASAIYVERLQCSIKLLEKKINAVEEKHKHQIMMLEMRHKREIMMLEVRRDIA